MASTLIGVYDTYAQAESALKDLLAMGFHRGDLEISPAEATPFGQQAALRGLEQVNADATDSLSLPQFFRALFGDDQDNRNADVYLEAVRRGSYLLIVQAENDEQRDRALDIMSRYGPVDIDARAAQWRSQGWSKYDISMPLLSDPDIGHERTLVTEERTTQPVTQVQGDPKGVATTPYVAPKWGTTRTELLRSAVKAFQRGL